MARSGKAPGRRRRNPPPLDELGGTADGGLAILNEAGELIHMTPARVAGSLRYFLARVQLHDAQGLAVFAALDEFLRGLQRPTDLGTHGLLRRRTGAEHEAGGNEGRRRGCPKAAT